MNKNFYALLLWSFFALSVLGQITLPGRVIDDAHVLSSSQKAELEAMLAHYQKSSGNQVIVMSVPSLLGKNIEEFGLMLGRKYGIGSAQKNNGVLFIIAPKERAVRIEVGYGLEGVLTDAQSKIIIERNILPFFKQGHMDQGVLQGTRAIIATLGGEGEVAPEPENKPYSDWSSLLFFIGMLVFLVIISNRGSGPRGPGFPRTRGPFSGSGQSRSGWGGGGISGGGGSFGGGGASGKW